MLYRRYPMEWLDNPRIRLMFRVCFWLLLIFAVVMLLLPHPPKTVFDRLGDKVEHMMAFGGLAGFGSFGFAQSNRWRVAERLSLLGALTEVIQSIPALHRSCDIFDWMADSSAIVLATAIASLILARAKPGPMSAG